ncbi:MAG: prepilin peptidase [Dehalococcoidia bacterium]|nr:MAG: prepilin peptidase [Dehalococcoidia bacterium]
MTALAIALFALLGLAVGSFLNLCIDRLPLGKSIISPPSHCDACQQRLKASDLVPLFSYLWLRGRCRYCGAHIPWRLPLVELVTALLFAFLTWHYDGLSLQLAIALIYGSLFLVIFVIDLEHRLVLDNVVYPGMALAFAFSFFWPWPEIVWPDIGVLSALLGGAIGFGLMFIPYLISRGGIGGGDVKLAGLIGLVTGFPLVFFALFLGILGGGLVAIALLISGVKSRKEPIPFAPFLAAAAMITLIWGPLIYHWYIGLL